MRGQHQPHDVILHVRGQNHLADELLPLENLLAVHHLGRLDRLAARRAVDDRRQFLRGSE